MTACKYCNEDFARLDRHEPYCKANPGVVEQEAEPPVPLLPVTLLKNYRPAGPYEVVGEEPEPPYPGVGIQATPEDPRSIKLWAGTVVKLPRDEVVRLIENVVISVETYKNEQGVPQQRRVRTKQPLAERADALPG